MVTGGHSRRCDKPTARQESTASQTSAAASLLAMGVAVFLSAGATQAEPPAPEYPPMSRSAWWAPYPLDGVTLRLFHLDELCADSGAEATAEKESEEDPLNPTAGEDDTKPRAPGKKRNEVRSESRTRGAGSIAVLKGNCELVPQARFGGGIHFKGGDGVLLCPNVNWDVGRTLEFWIRVETAPERHITLAHLRTTENPTYSLALQLSPQRTLCPAWAGARLAETQDSLPLRDWSHLCLQWSYADGTLAVRLLLNGRDAGSWMIPYNWTQHCSTRREGLLAVGNDSAAGAGVHALVDEIRLSEVLRTYYPVDTDTTGLGGKGRAGNGPPHFRDERDLVLYLPFNRTTAAANAPPNLRVSTAAQPDIGEESRFFAPAVDGQGLLVGQNTLGPMYELPDLLKPATGTAALWVLPVDWDNYTRDNIFDPIYPAFIDVFHVWGTFPRGAAPDRWNRTVPILRLVILQNPHSSVQHTIDFRPGRWVHLAVTWEKDDICYYVDGQPWLHPGSIALITVDNDYWIWGKAGRPKGTAWTCQASAHTLSFQRLSRSLWHPYWHPRTQDPHTLVDEFRVYRRALSPAEIANLVAIHDRRRELAELPAADMAFRYNGVTGYIDAVACPLVPSYERLTKAIFDIRKQGDPAPLLTKAMDVRPLERTQVRLETPPLDFATYTITARFQDGQGTTGAEVARSFTRERPPWWETRAGLSDKVMPDWDPVRVNGNVVSVVLRDIHFAASGFPERIVSAGEDVLSSPATIRAASRKQSVPLSPVSERVTVISAKDTRADLKGSLNAPDWTVTSQVAIEFDGMVWFTVTIEPREGTSPVLDDLTITIPYARDNARLVHWWSGNSTGADDTNFPERNQCLGDLPTGDGDLFRSNDPKQVNIDPRQRGSFIPYVLLTGMKRGMAWFASNDRGWTQNPDVPAVSIVGQGTTVSLVLRIVSSPISLDKPRAFEFGLHPIPVKKLRKDWRRWPGWGVQADFGATFRGGPSWWNSLGPVNDDWQAVSRLWEANEDPGVRRMRESQDGFHRTFRKRYGRDPEPHERPELAIYTCLPDPGPAPAHSREWEEEWTYVPRYPYRGGPILTRGFLDFASWCWDSWFQHSLVKGIYVDGSNVPPEFRSPGRYAYALPDGHVQSGYQWLGVREYLKRMRQASWDRGVVPHICCHMTNQIYIPQLAFADVMLDGEDKYSSPARPTDFIDHWPPDRMRINHVEKWGIVPKWLGWHVNTPRKDGTLAAWDYRQNRAWIANLALHDIQWNFGGPYDDSPAFDFGLYETDVTFVPYWDLQGLAEVVRATPRPPAVPPDGEPEPSAKPKPDPDDPEARKTILISAWRRPGKCLVLLVNRGNHRVDTELTFDRQAMGLGPGPAGVLIAQDVDTILIPPAVEDYLNLRTPETTGKEVVLATEEPGKGGAEEETVEDEIKAASAPKTPSPAKPSDHPDAQFSWKDGVLRCPIRRHDFRLFVFRPGDTP